MKTWFNFLQNFLCVAIVTADTPDLRKLLLLKCFTVALMTKMQFKQNTSKKLDFRIVASHRNDSFSRLNWKVGQNKKKHDSNCCKLRTRKSRFFKKKMVSFFCGRQGVGVGCCQQV